MLPLARSILSWDVAQSGIPPESLSACSRGLRVSDVTDCGCHVSDLVCSAEIVCQSESRRRRRKVALRGIRRQRDKLCCGETLYTVERRSVLWRDAVYCGETLCAVRGRSMLWGDALYCGETLCAVERRYVLWGYALCCGKMLCTVWRCSVL